MSSAPGLLSALPEGWVMLGRCRTGTAGPASYPTGCWALAHPTTGIALVDVAPDATPNAEARLRRALGAANFWPAFPGYLPVWHGRIELSAWRSLPGIMAEGFSELPPLTVPGKGAWIAAARMALASDPAWDIPGAPRGARVAALPAPAEEEEVEEPPALPPVRQRLPLRPGLLLGFAVTFAVGLASGALLLAGDDPSPDARLTAPVAAAVGPLAPTLSPAVLPAIAPGPLPEAARPAPEPAVAPLPSTAEQAPPASPSPQPVVDAAPMPPPAVTASDAAGSSEPLEPVEAVPAALPLPPLAPKAPERKVSSAPPRIDRACSEAQYRFQQGLPLTAKDAAYLREGCSTRR